MRPMHYSLLIHFIGIGLIFTTIVAGWILNGQYRRASDWKTKASILASLRPIGLLSPLATFIMVASGIGNMTLGERTYTLFSDSWLSYKLVFFLILAVSGILSWARSSRRSKLVRTVSEGTAPEGIEGTIRALDRQQRVLFIFQAALILVILTLTIVQPHG